MFCSNSFLAHCYCAVVALHWLWLTGLPHRLLLLAKIASYCYCYHYHYYHYYHYYYYHHCYHCHCHSSQSDRT